MDSLTQSTLTPNKTRLSRAFAKVLHIQKTKSNEKLKHNKPNTDDKIQHCGNVNPTLDAFIAKVFATVSSVKAAYAQLQVAQTPYDPVAIQSTDQIIVSELKRLSEFKQLFLKKHLEDDIYDPETTILLAEIQEQKNLLPMYEITARKLDSQTKLKDSEIIFLKEKLNEANQENKMIERRLKLKLNSSGNLSDHEKFNFSPREKLNFSYRTINGFLISLQQTTTSIKSFVKLLMSEMEDAKWDLYAAASSIHPDVVLWDKTHTCFSFESFVCRVMFDGFNNPGFDSNSHLRSPQFFFDGFMELKSLKAKEFITWKPNSMFAKFCRLKYLKLVHPKMESSLFGNLNQRNLVSEGKFPETNFFMLFADVARRVWLLHCLAFAFDSDKPSAFQVREGIQFTEVFMESVNENEAPSNSSPEVGFTVVPGFKVGGTIVQCQVYLI